MRSAIQDLAKTFFGWGLVFGLFAVSTSASKALLTQAVNAKLYFFSMYVYCTPKYQQQLDLTGLLLKLLSDSFMDLNILNLEMIQNT